MKTARERAQEIVKRLPSALLDRLTGEMLSDAIEQELKNVAKDQRDAIALKIDDETHGCNIGLDGEYAYSIAVNTIAV